MGGLGSGRKPQHGHARKGQKTSEYKAWTSMRERCANPLNQAYRWYGGRGITVCERWKSFDNFIADMGPRPPGLWLERVDNDGNYEPSNCKWETRKVQLKNRRPPQFDITWFEMWNNNSP